MVEGDALLVAEVDGRRPRCRRPAPRRNMRPTMRASSSVSTQPTLVSLGVGTTTLTPAAFRTLSVSPRICGGELVGEETAVGGDESDLRLLGQHHVLLGNVGPDGICMQSSQRHARSSSRRHCNKPAGEREWARRPVAPPPSLSLGLAGPGGFGHRADGAALVSRPSRPRSLYAPGSIRGRDARDTHSHGAPLQRRCVVVFFVRVAGLLVGLFAFAGHVAVGGLVRQRLVVFNRLVRRAVAQRELPPVGLLPGLERKRALLGVLGDDAGDADQLVVFA